MLNVRIISEKLVFYTDVEEIVADKNRPLYGPVLADMSAHTVIKLQNKFINQLEGLEVCQKAEQ